jgi:disulfide oxidoreductase YuzD
MKEENKKGKSNIKKINNILSDKKPKDSKNFDVVYMIDATGSMGEYITAAKEESQNISKELKEQYPDMKFKYGYIFYRDPVDAKEDSHEIIDLTDEEVSLPEKIGKIQATGGGDLPEDWVGAYQLANEKISWRDGIKVIIHLADAGAHGKLFTTSDKYPEEEAKLIKELEICATKDIEIFAYVIDNSARKSFEECSKIYRSKGGCYEIFEFYQIKGPEFMNPSSMKVDMDMMKPKINDSNPMMFNNMGMMNMNSMMNAPNPMMNGFNNMNMMNAPSPMFNSAPMMNMSNMNFRNNALNSISISMRRNINPH